MRFSLLMSPQATFCRIFVGIHIYVLLILAPPNMSTVRINAFSQINAVHYGQTHISFESSDVSLSVKYARNVDIGFARV